MKKIPVWKKVLPPVLAAIALFVAVAPDILQGWQAAEREAQQQAERGAGQRNTAVAPQRATDRAANADNRALYALMRDQRSGEMVQGQGVVEKVLKDDNDGSRHQRFILDVGAGKTLLVAHNIDLAPRLPDLRAGDVVRFYGQYESNVRGGVLHWTHHDPAGRHPEGWLEYKGKRYE